MKNSVLVIFIVLSLLSTNCHNESSNKNIKPNQNKQTSSKKEASKNLITIDIVPFEETPQEIVKYLFENLKLICPNVILKNSISFPENAYYRPRNRYKADSLINFLSSITQNGHITIGITNKDISTSKDNIEDWGVMGLSFEPGNACVVSTFRLNKNNLLDQFFKVSIHELGHTQGLDHCENKTCFMRDAEGKNTTDQEKEFCPKCKALLIKKGWMIK